MYTNVYDNRDLTEEDFTYVILEYTLPMEGEYKPRKLSRIWGPFTYQEKEKELQRFERIGITEPHRLEVHAIHRPEWN